LGTGIGPLPCFRCQAEALAKQKYKCKVHGILQGAEGHTICVSWNDPEREKQFGSGACCLMCYSAWLKANFALEELGDEA
jgi:hypothetical protein